MPTAPPAAEQPEQPEQPAAGQLTLPTLQWLHQVVGNLPVGVTIGDPRFRGTAQSAMRAMDELEAAIEAQGGTVAAPPVEPST